MLEAISCIKSMPIKSSNHNGITWYLNTMTLLLLEDAVAVITELTNGFNVKYGTCCNGLRPYN